MNKYNYFPGCSIADGAAKAYNESTKEIARVLDIELAEIPDWNCCGSTPFSSCSELGSICLAARNLSKVKEPGADTVTSCSACYILLKSASEYIKNDPEVKRKVDESLAAAELAYNGSSNVRHLLDIVVNDVGYEQISSKVTRPLAGKKIGAYYGCQIVRPKFGLDHSENPQLMEKLITALGAEAIDFPLKTNCCGSYFSVSTQDKALDLMRRIFESAHSSGAEMLITVCPLCQLNLDGYQSKVNKKYKTDYKLPVLFFTQLMGIAFGIDEKKLMLKKNIVSPAAILSAGKKE